jgi:cell division septation protein DedD
LYAVALAALFAVYVVGLSVGKSLFSPEKPGPPAAPPTEPAAAELKKPAAGDSKEDLAFWVDVDKKTIPVSPVPSSPGLSESGASPQRGSPEGPANDTKETPAEPSSPLPGAGVQYTVQVGAHRSYEEARKVLVRLELRGHPGIIDKPSGGQDPFYHVRVGTYDTLEAARQTEALLKQDGFLTYIKKLRPGSRGE